MSTILIIILLIILFGGVYFLARSPLVATVRSEEEEAKLLGARHRHSPAGLLGAPGAAELAEDLSREDLGSNSSDLPAHGTQPEAGMKPII